MASDEEHEVDVPIEVGHPSRPDREYLMRQHIGAIKMRVWWEGHRDVCNDCCCPESSNPYRAVLTAQTEEASDE